MTEILNGKCARTAGVDTSSPDDTAVCDIDHLNCHANLIAVMLDRSVEYGVDIHFAARSERILTGELSRIIGRMHIQDLLQIAEFCLERVSHPRTKLNHPHRLQI